MKARIYEKDFANQLEELKKVTSRKARINSIDDFSARVAQMVNSGAGVSRFDLERYIGTIDFLRFNYLQRGIIAGNPVSRIRVSDPVGAGGEWGTGFLISPRLLLTNNHVIRSPEEARQSRIEFGYQTDLNGFLHSGKLFQLLPEQAFITHLEEELDYSIIAISEVSIDNTAKTTDYGFLRLIPTLHKVDVLEYVTIIQHPNGDEKCVALRENKVIKIGDERGDKKDNYLWYACDTATGSSGAPVFNDQWQVVALHHKSVAETQMKDGQRMVVLKDGSLIPEVEVDYRDNRIKFIANEGVRISKIVENVKQQFPSKPFPLIKELLDDIDGIASIEGTIPNESVVEGVLPPTSMGPALGTTVFLERARKNIRPIEYYSGREGYQEDFLTTPVPIPELTEKALSFGNVADVKNTSDRVLRYTHFSVVFNEDRRMPFYTAVNIDGSKWKGLNRGDDTWYYDPRIAIELQVGDELYSREPRELGSKGWFDRGHLVRRLDPVWGSKAIAFLADEDSFHWTNCAPQYWEFNQGNELWQGLENYILYNTDSENVKATVFTGPVFREDDQLHRDVYIPQYYWKVVVVENGAGELFSSAYIADHREWANDIPFEELPVGRFADYQVSLRKIQSITGLQFSCEVTMADVLKTNGDRGLRGLTDIVHPRR